jgi:hypothetical protein
MSGLQPSASGWNVTWGYAPGWYMSGLRPYFNATKGGAADAGITMTSNTRIIFMIL